MKKKHYLLFLLASLFLLTDVVWAQTSATVSGVVIDENGETLPLVLLLTVIVPIINTSFIHLCYNAPIIQSIPQPTITLAEELLWNWIKNVFRSAGISRWC